MNKIAGFQTPCTSGVLKPLQTDHMEFSSQRESEQRGWRGRGVDKRTMAIVWITQISYGPVQKPAEPQCCKQHHVQSLILTVA